MDLDDLDDDMTNFSSMLDPKKGWVMLTRD